MDSKKLVGWILVVAAVNWGLVGLLNLDIIALILGAGSMLTKIVYIIVGVVGVYKGYMMLGGKYDKKK